MEERLKTYLRPGEQVRWQGRPAPFSLLEAEAKKQILLKWGLTVALGGGLLAFGVMWLLVRCRRLSLFGVCIAGAAAHNTGQVLAAMAVLASPALLVYLAPLLLASLVTGAVTGAASILLVRRVPPPDGKP